MEQNEVAFLFAQYKELRKDLQKTPPRMSAKAQKQIEKALTEVTFDELKLVLHYFSEARDDYTAFMRGNNDLNKDYVKLDSLLRITKLKEKVARAKAWQLKGKRKDRTVEHALRQKLTVQTCEDDDLFLPLKIVRGDK